MVDIHGQPLELLLTPGQQHDCTVADRLIDFISGNACLADGSYDTDAILKELDYRGIKAVIPSGSERKKKRRHDKKLYKLRYRVVCFFHDLKRFRRVATMVTRVARPSAHSNNLLLLPFPHNRITSHAWPTAWE